MPRSQSKCNTPLTLIPFHDVSTLQCIYTTDTAAAWLKLYVICVYIQLPSLLLLLSYHCPPLKHSPILRLINNLKTIIIYHRFLLFLLVPRNITRSLITIIADYSFFIWKKNCWKFICIIWSIVFVTHMSIKRIINFLTHTQARTHHTLEKLKLTLSVKSSLVRSNAGHTS